MRPQADIKSALPEICLTTSDVNRLGDERLNVNGVHSNYSSLILFKRYYGFR